MSLKPGISDLNCISLLISPALTLADSVSPPSPFSSSRSDTPPHIPQPRPTHSGCPCSGSHIPSGHSPRVENHPSSLSCSQSPARTCWSFLFGMAMEIRPGKDPFVVTRLRGVGRGEESRPTAQGFLTLVLMTVSVPPSTEAK